MLIKKEKNPSETRWKTIHVWVGVIHPHSLTTFNREDDPSSGFSISFVLVLSLPTGQSLQGPFTDGALIHQEGHHRGLRACAERDVGETPAGGLGVRVLAQRPIRPRRWEGVGKVFAFD